MAEPAHRPLARTQRLAGWAYFGLEAMIFGGLLAAFAGWRTGALILLAGLGGTFGIHLTVGIAGYRESMRRPWPAVRALDDDDDDW